MNMTRRSLVVALLAAAGGGALTACGGEKNSMTTAATTPSAADAATTPEETTEPLTSDATSEPTADTSASALPNIGHPDATGGKLEYTPEEAGFKFCSLESTMLTIKDSWADKTIDGTSSLQSVFEASGYSIRFDSYDFTRGLVLTYPALDAQSAMKKFVSSPKAGWVDSAAALASISDVSSKAGRPAWSVTSDFADNNSYNYIKSGVGFALQSDVGTDIFLMLVTEEGDEQELKDEVAKISDDILTH